MQFTFESLVSSNFGRLSKLDCFCPYLSVFILDCVPLILFLWNLHTWGPPGVLGIWGEWLFIFRELGSTGNYFQGFGEQAHSFGDLGSPAK